MPVSMRFTASMSPNDSLRFPNDDPAEFRKSLAATAILIALFALLGFAPHRDPTKVVAGVPCSVLSEKAVGSVLGTTVQLMPTNGTICQYVSTGADGPRSMFVIARHDARPPSRAGSTSPIIGTGDEAYRIADALYVRYGSHAYTIVVPHAADRATAWNDQLRAAHLMSRNAIAQNR